MQWDDTFRNAYAAKFNVVLDKSMWIRATFVKTIRLLAFQVPVQPDFNFIDMCTSLDPYSLFHSYFEQVMVFNEGDFPQACSSYHP